MNKCFVIQPFDGGVFDKRFDDIFLPAIEKAGLEAYRVDRDPAVSIPIVDIQKGIEDSEICLAEIATDNPNVWFELGFAIASQKEVVLVCSSERKKFPFDIQHRNIIKYTNESASDFDKLEKTITERMRAVLKKQKEIGRVSALSPIADSDGLSTHEMVTLVTVMQNQFSPDEQVAASRIKEDMIKAGFTEIAASLGLARLREKNMVSFLNVTEDGTGTFSAYRTYPAYQVTQKGMDWLFRNEDKLALRTPEDVVPF